MQTHLGSKFHGLLQSASRNARSTYVCLALSGLVGVSGPSRAADGCLVLLCFAAPSWNSIQQCIPPIQQVLNDLAHGRPFPSCPMAGAANSASHRWSNPPDFCPPQYSHVDWLESGARYTCEYVGAVEVDINGALWSRTWWRMSGDTITDFSPAAKDQLRNWDTRFEDDYARWLGQQAPADPCAGC